MNEARAGSSEVRVSATEELRRMLDERGVKWDELQSYEGGKMTRWRDGTGRYVTAYDDGVVEFFSDFYWQPTPQQAIDATLGRGTCKDVSGGDPCAFVCSECNATYDHPADEPILYCPNCGRRVEP